MFTVTEQAMRPATSRRECFYCHQPIGEEHKADCVFIRRKVKVRAIVEYEIVVPSAWGKEDVEFHRNESSWCADNMLQELETVQKEGQCLCPLVRYEFIENASDPYLDEK